MRYICSLLLVVALGACEKPVEETPELSCTGAAPPCAAGTREVEKCETPDCVTTTVCDTTRNCEPEAPSPPDIDPTEPAGEDDEADAGAAPVPG